MMLTHVTHQPAPTRTPAWGRAQQLPHDRPSLQAARDISGGRRLWAVGGPGHNGADRRSPERPHPGPAPSLAEDHGAPCPGHQGTKHASRWQRPGLMWTEWVMPALRGLGCHPRDPEPRAGHRAGGWSGQPGSRATRREGTGQVQAPGGRWLHSGPVGGHTGAVTSPGLSWGPCGCSAGPCKRPSRRHRDGGGRARASSGAGAQWPWPGRRQGLGPVTGTSGMVGHT